MMLDTPGPKWLDITYKTSYILLLTSVTLSFLLIAVPFVRKKWPKSKGYIQLPDTLGTPTRKALFNKLLLEYIDSGLANDGEPVDITGFWKSVSVGSTRLGEAAKGYSAHTRSA